jgi:hypothetical protein
MFILSTTLPPIAVQSGKTICHIGSRPRMIEKSAAAGLSRLGISSLPKGAYAEARSRRGNSSPGRLGARRIVAREKRAICLMRFAGEFPLWLCGSACPFFSGVCGNAWGICSAPHSLAPIGKESNSEAARCRRRFGLRHELLRSAEPGEGEDRLIGMCRNSPGATGGQYGAGT